MESSSHEQIPVSSRLADDRQLARWPSQRVAERCRLSKTSCDMWPAAARLSAHHSDKGYKHRHWQKVYFHFFFSKGSKYGVASFDATAFSLIASAGFFPINLVISPFREHTSGSLLTQAVDCCPSRSRISTPYGNRSGVQQGCGWIFPRSQWISVRLCQMFVLCFSISLVTMPMNSRPVSTCKSCGHFKEPHLVLPKFVGSMIRVLNGILFGSMYSNTAQTGAVCS